MRTSEVRGTDRINLRPLSLLGPLTGSSVSLTEPPTFAVTWRDVDLDFTALVREFSSSSLDAWVYSFALKATNPQILLWRLAPGEYELHITPELKDSGSGESQATQIIPFEYRERPTKVRFELPPNVLCQLSVVQKEQGADRPVHLPDLACNSRELVIEATPTVNVDCSGKLIVHNIGSVDAHKVIAEIRAIPQGNEGEESPINIATVKLGTIPCPSDFTAKVAEAKFTWRPAKAGSYRLEAEVSCSDDNGEIYSGNNLAAIQLQVK
jgi:hypothetical protein